MAGSSPHAWHFIRIGGLDQVALESAADLKALGTLDPKSWVALSWPTKGIELDPRTLALLDTDNDGHIRVPEVIAAVDWAIARLKDPNTLLTGAQDLPLDVVNDATPEGQIVLKAARQLPGYDPKSTVAVAKDAADAVKSLSKGALQGDGVLRPEAGDSETQQLIREIADTTGEVNEKNTAAFFADCEAFKAWSGTAGSISVAGLGSAAAEAFSAVAAVRAKVEDYFARCSLAAFDEEAEYGLNRTVDDYRALANKSLSGASAEVSVFPLAHISPKRSLPLVEGVNPAWAGAITRMRNSAITPLLGARTELSEEDWASLTDKLKPFDSWIDTKPPVSVSKLGLDRVNAIVAGQGKAKIAQLFQADAALKPFSDIERLALYVRDLKVLLRNFVNFFDFYHRERWAVFQAGTLYLDARACKLCLKVGDVASHSTNAGMSRAYIAYLDCKRPAGASMKIAACFTEGDSDYLFVGRNGVFYDRLGQDWDATIIKVIEGPISIRQAFFAPYKRVASFVEDQFAKYAASKDQLVTNNLTTAASAPSAAQSTFDIAKFAGIFAALGVAFGAISVAITSAATHFMGLAPWQMPVAAIGALLLISGPSMILAMIKLRQRNLGPLLEASGWAVNGRVKINIPFGTALTERAAIPHGSKHQLTDPYADKNWEAQKKLWSTLIILVLFALILANVLHTWPFAPKPVGPVPAAAKAAPAK